MTINVNDIKIFQAQDNTDNDSGGGSRTSEEIVDGDVNNLFPDISRIDTVSGDVALRKIFPTVYTANRDIYYGAHSIIRKKPTDPKVSALLFHSDDPHDKRIDAQNDIESYVVASYVEQFYLFGNHVAGSKTVTFLQTLTQTPPVVGEVYLLIDPTTTEQYIRIVDIDQATIILSYDSGSGIVDYQRRRIICEIEQGLEIDFVGSQFHPTGQEDDTTTTYATQIADAAKFYGTRDLAEDANSGETAIKVDTIYEALVPSSKAQTPLVNQPAMSRTKSLALTTRSVIYNVSFNNVAYEGHLGCAVVPGSISWQGTVDDGLGNLVSSANGEFQAYIDYATGLISDPSNLMQLSGSVPVSFDVAGGTENDLQFTGSILITSGNQSLVFVKNLSPIPSRGQIYIDYRSRGKWYRIAGNFDGSVGGDPSIGAGNINDNGDGTGTLSLTLGSLPDIDSSIIVSWGSITRFNDRYLAPGVDGYELVLRFILDHGDIDPTSFSMIAHKATVPYTITCDANGVLSDTAGAITGELNLSSGEILITDASATNRFDNVGSDDDVVISYDYSDPAPASDGEHKTAVIVEGGFTTLVRSTNDYTFNIGEGVVRESVHLRFNIDFTHNTFWAWYYDTPTFSSLHLYSDSSGNLRRYTRSFNGDTTIWGTVAANGDVVLDLQQVTTKDITSLASNFTTNLRYATNLRRARLVDGVSVTVNYKSELAASFPNSNVMTDKIENLADYMIKLPEMINGEVLLNVFRDSTNGINHCYSVDGVVYSTPSVTAPIQVGTIDYATGVVVMDYTTYPDNFYLEVPCVFTDESQDEDTVGLVYDFKTAATKIIPSSLQLRYYTSADQGVLKTATSDANGAITGVSINGTNSYVDAETGMVHLEFTVPSFPDSIKYDAVAETSLPIDPDLLGLNPIRLPADGRVPVFENGRHLVIFDEVTTATTNATPLADDVETLARSGQSYIEVIDSEGKRLDPVQYVADRVAGTVTFGNPLTLEDKYAVALTAPFYVVDRVEDMLLAADVQISGDIDLSAGLSHNYTAANSKVASALVWGDTGSRVFNYFAQEIWNSGNPVWQDTLDGDPTTAQYDDVNYPIQIDNQSSTSGRWAIIFTSATTVQVAHEKLGIVAASFSLAIEDVAPINPATGSPYFTMPKEGFGAGWVTNNVIRINTDSGDVNMWVIRTVQSGALSELEDNVEIEVRGDAN